MIRENCVNVRFIFISVLPERIQKTKEFNSTASINMLPLAKGNLEYIKPLKISQNQYEDPRKYLK